MLSRKQWKIDKIDSCNKKAVTRIDKNDAEITKYVSYILLLIDEKLNEQFLNTHKHSN